MNAYRVKTKKKFYTVVFFENEFLGLLKRKIWLGTENLKNSHFLFELALQWCQLVSFYYQVS